jgi:copper-binding protein NosD
MRREFVGLRTSMSAVVLVVLLPALADAAARYVADTGDDVPNCGLTTTTACRSITQAIALAAAGETIIVGPGRYGDLNRNGVLGDISGEEIGSPGCSCVLSINKNVIVISSAGAAVTMIDGRTVDVIQNVLLITNGGEFGRLGKGFTVTQTAFHDGFRFHGNGIVLDSANVMVRGNQVVFTRRARFEGTEGVGILTVNDAPIRIEGNQVIGWETGISARGAAIVSKNQVWHNENGIVATGGTVVGNVATANLGGIVVTGSAQILSNGVYANAVDDDGSGIAVRGPFNGVIKKNNLFANPSGGCGLVNIGVIGLAATNNYWGVATGPGAPPADDVCNFNGGTTTTSPFATKPFAVKVLKP